MPRREWSVVAVALLAIAGANQWILAHDWRGDPPEIKGWPDGPRSGDEPHYVVALHSLLFDGDLDLRDDYASAAAGGDEAGGLFRGQVLDHHTILLDPETGRNVSWQALWKAHEPRPCDEPGCVPFAAREPHGFEDLARVVEVPAHPPAFPMLLAGLLAPFSPAPDELDRAAGKALRWVATATLLATFVAGLAAGLGPRWALLAVACLALASPWLVFGKSFFSEGTASLFVTAALAAQLAGLAWLAAPFALVALALKPALVVVGAGFILERAQARDWRSAAWTTGIMAVGGLAWAAFQMELTGRPVLSGAFDWAAPDGLTSAWGTWIDKYHGLLPFAPWVVVAAFAAWRPPGDASLRLRRVVGSTVLLHWLLVSSYGALGGTCFGPRYWVPFLPGLALWAAAAAREGGRATRVALAALAVAGALLNVPSALQYHRVWDRSPYWALLEMGSSWLGR